MKTILSILIFFGSFTTYAQLNADAGTDKVACTGSDTTAIGGNPTASGGTPPYTFTWEATYSYFGYIYHASDLLNDTTVSNPIVVNSVNADDWIEFVVTVEDANSVSRKDTMKLRYSRFIDNFGNYTYNIQQGDSVWLAHGVNVYGGIPPYEYLWRPNHGLSDSTSLAFWAKPDYSIIYYPLVTDSAGCTAKGGAFYFINVTPVSVSENLKQEKGIDVYPNPATNNLKVTAGNDISFPVAYKVLNSLGAVVNSGKLNDVSSRIETGNLNPGVYYFYTVDAGGCVFSTRFIIGK